MLIAEIFYSIQGEGTLVGVPSVFIRTSGCNLRCRWCDTPYASWEPKGDEMSVAEVAAAVSQYSAAAHVVVTGGEPMIAKEMPALLAALRAAGKHITIETAGTVLPGEVPCDLASISPKLANSTPDVATAGAAWVARHEAVRRQPDVLRAWCQRGEFQLKFVISSSEDIVAAAQVVDSIGVPIPPDRVLVMAEGISVEALRSRQELLVETCKERGWRYSPRLHIDLFGNRRGT
ncbi:MAG: 7-carboxy-7-deazaguanine synthase QueE [Verrucomicrobiales bacterium]|nr:7-carboxy-7-deazaguanine synthase QueE [Verrucomicrobiales bacterium]MCP5558794.1 7-carboxy-7-deazaguanine synthase QueE [Verrucomicrobiaceae bacterium]